MFELYKRCNIQNMQDTKKLYNKLFEKGERNTASGTCCVQFRMQYCELSTELK